MAQVGQKSETTLRGEFQNGRHFRCDQDHERTVSAEPSVSSTPVRVVNSSRLSCFVAYLVAYSIAEKWSMSGLKNVGALRKLHALVEE